MVSRNTAWEILKNWSGIVFLVAGGLLLTAAGVDGINAFTTLTIPPSVDAFAGFGGTVLSVVGLLGLYPRLTTGDVRLARAGILLVVSPAVFVFGLFIKNILAQFVEVPSLTAMIPSLGFVTGIVFLLFAVGIATFGVISLRTDVLSDSTGGLLLVFAVTWIGLLAAIPVYGFPIPYWVVFATTGMQGVAMVGIGHRLRTDPNNIDQTARASGSTA